ncbi:hypothetical protein [Fumia xinanensis]|uniref:Uncharacterized protein n=1 Tax=Fumia xinanensis TaxID=2763659 RepID=A0A926E6B0_9FIRM|nr:hypothetical protein [Fumia xinanensis]MBC8560275.1 hypothetical protein [Fumia xinanensis]
MMQTRSKKWHMILPLLLLATACLSGWLYLNTGDRLCQRYNRYCFELNEQIKDESFLFAEVKWNSIELLNRDRKVYKTIKLESFRFWHPVKGGISQEHPGVVLYALGGAADDSVGVVFVNDPALNGELDGIDWVIRRGYHKEGEPEDKTHGEGELGISGLSQWMPDAGCLKRLGENSYRYSTRWDY